jgi:hypothetical protein
MVKRLDDNFAVLPPEAGRRTLGLRPAYGGYSHSLCAENLLFLFFWKYRDSIIPKKHYLVFSF